jgi:MFS family permease
MDGNELSAVHIPQQPAPKSAVTIIFLCYTVNPFIISYSSCSYSFTKTMLSRIIRCKILMLMNKNKFFYGWVIVGVSFINLAVIFGIWYSFSVFFVAIIKEFGWSRAATAGVFSCFMLVHSISAVLIGVFLDRLSPRVIFPAAAFIVALGLVASGSINALWQFYLWYGVLTPIGICALGFIAHGMIIPKWFDRQRGLAMGIAMAGIGLGMQLLVPATQFFISSWGWRSAYLALAVLIVVVLVPLNIIFQRKNPEEVGQNPDGAAPFKTLEQSKSSSAPRAVPRTPPIAGTIREAMRTKPFWFLAASFFFTPMAIQGTLIHQVASVVDKGFSAAQGAFFFGLAGIMGSAGKIIFGHLSDMIGREKAFALGLSCAFFGVVSLLLLEPGKGALLYAYAVLFGLGYGSIAPIFPARLADLFLGPHFGKITGVLFVAGGAGGAVGVWLNGKIFDLTASYSISFIISLCAMVMAVTFFKLAGSLKHRQSAL